jgi:hypothetical protein
MRLGRVRRPGESGTLLDLGHDSCLAAGCGHWEHIRDQWGTMGKDGRSWRLDSESYVWVWEGRSERRRIQLFSCGSTSTL